MGPADGGRERQWNRKRRGSRDHRKRQGNLERREKRGWRYRTNWKQKSRGGRRNKVRRSKAQSTRVTNFLLPSTSHTQSTFCYLASGRVFGRNCAKGFPTDTSVHLTWIDRQNVIEPDVFDLVDDLPHFLLLLLILQRFDDAKWGHFTECPQSGLKTESTAKLPTASFVADDETGQKITTHFYPSAHEIYLGTTLLGRGTNVIGGRKGPSLEITEIPSTEALREGNDIAVKIYWPEEERVSEAEILEKAKERGRKIPFIRDHIPEMVCHRDPNFLGSSTKTIRQFLGLPTDGSRRLRVIVFGLLRSIKELKERDMLTAYLQCFFCKHRERTTPNALLTDLLCRPLLFVEEGDPTRGHQPREPDVG